MKSLRCTFEREKGPETKPVDLPFLLLVVTAAVCGGFVMVIEILGSKVIGPYFGVSLFVWTALITVSLVALAAGYAAGGCLSDRNASPGCLYGVIAVAGTLILIIPVIKDSVIRFFLPSGLRWGAMASSAVIFGPALFLLGCVSPYLIKNAVKEMRHVGKTVGLLYAVSTVGSVAGTVITGFFLLAWLPVTTIFYISGYVLVVLALYYFVIARKKIMCIVLVMIPLASFCVEPLDRKRISGDAVVTELANRETFYGNVRIIESYNGKEKVREMAIDGLIQGGIDLADGKSIYPYSYMLQFLPYSLNPKGKSCLVLGLGAGIIPMWYQQQGVSTDVVEINSEIATLAHDYFGYTGSVQTYIADARYYLATAEKQYDYIIMDVASGDTVPAHLLTVEAFALAKARQTRGGILGINLIGNIVEYPYMTASVVKTLKKLYKTVEVVPLFDIGNGLIAGNIIVIASDLPSVPFSSDSLKSFDIHPSAELAVRRFASQRFRFHEKTEAVVLTDDYCPADYFELPVKESLRKRILNSPLIF